MLSSAFSSISVVIPSIAIAVNSIVSVTTPSAVIVNAPLNVPDVVGANTLSTEPSDSLKMLNPY